MKRGKEACDSPRINARRFEEMVVGNIRSNILTEGNIRALVKVVDERMDGVAAEQRKRLETIKDELEDVKRKLGRIWHLVETTDTDMADASDRIREHRERQRRPEASAEEARAILSQRREVLDDVETITTYAQDMSEFLKDSELTERRAFIETFVKEIVVMPGKAVVRYTVPMPDDSPIPGKRTEDMVLNGSVLSTVKSGPPEEDRTTPHAVAVFKDHSSPSQISMRAPPAIPPPSRCHTTGIERPWCVERLPSHISKMGVSTVCAGGPTCTVDRTEASRVTFSSARPAKKLSSALYKRESTKC